jgi:hypothetical protein
LTDPSPFLWVRQAEEKNRWRYPIRATINGEEAILWNDWTEWPEEEPDPYEPDYEPDDD